MLGLYQVSSEAAFVSAADWVIKSQVAEIPIKMNKTAAMYLASSSLYFAFLNAKTAPESDINQITNPDMIGATTCMHGYVALEGLGITRTRNQIVASTEITITTSFEGTFILLRNSMVLFIHAGSF